MTDKQNRTERRVFDKLSWLSRVLGEVDDWLDTRQERSARSQEPLSIDNLDGHIAREGRRA